jgi:hypothetical protein
VKEEFGRVDIEDWSQDGNKLSIDTYEEVYVDGELNEYNWTYSAVIGDEGLKLTDIKKR